MKQNPNRITFYLVGLYLSIVLILYIIFDDLNVFEAFKQEFLDFFTGLFHRSESHNHIVTEIASLSIAYVGSIIIFMTFTWIAYRLINLITIQERTKKRWIENLIQYIPNRQFFIALFFSITIISTIFFALIEKRSLIDAFYFVIVTMSTVGFGDIAPTTDATKFLSILLIFNGVTFLGLASQLILNQIIKAQLNRGINLPKNPLTLKNHIIVVGFGSKGRRVANLFRNRKYKVLVIDIDPVRFDLAVYNEFMALNTDIGKPDTLQLINLEECAGLFLILDDDDMTIQTGILAKTYFPNLEIYAELNHINTYSIARYAGITRPITFSHYLINVIRSHLLHRGVNEVYPLRDLRTQEATLGFIQVPLDYDYRKAFDTAMDVGTLSLDIMELFIHPQLCPSGKAIHAIKDATHRLIVVDKEELVKIRDLDEYNAQYSRHPRMVLAGFPEYADTFLERLEYKNDEIVVLWQSDEERMRLRQSGYEIHKWSIENGFDLLKEIIKEDDLVLCFFEDITSSLLISVALKQLEIRSHQVQLVPYDYDIETINAVGSDLIITPEIMVPQALLTSFFKTNALPPSIVFANFHIFEHLVFEDDYFVDKAVNVLCSEDKILLFIRKAGELDFRNINPDDIVEVSDRILLATRIE